MSDLYKAAEQALKALQNAEIVYMEQLEAMYALQAALEHPNKEWVGLTDDEITELCELVKTNNLSWGRFARKLEDRLKEKNG